MPRLKRNSYKNKRVFFKIIMDEFRTTKKKKSENCACGVHKKDVIQMRICVKRFKSKNKNKAGLKLSSAGLKNSNIKYF